MAYQPMPPVPSPFTVMRLGIFGGSFDPLHHGHLVLADCCAEGARLDELWFVPTAHQPLKPSGPQATDVDRLAMLQLALEDHDRYSISEIEIERGGVSYTATTLAEVKLLRPDAKLFFLMGADSLADFPKWHEPERICELATPLVVRRAGLAEPDFAVLKDIVSPSRMAEIQEAQVEMPEVPISSSEIRKLVANDGAWQHLVPRVIANYIESHSLYENRD